MAGGRVILIAGPTASGKSALAIDLASELDGVIINADSMQLYKDLRLVSARPSDEEEREVPHRLYGVLQASTAFSTGAWLRLATEEIEAVRAAGKLPVLVGGTGLYFKGLTEGFAEMPEIPSEIREQARDLADQEGVARLKEELAHFGDHESAATLADPQRLARALEVVMATGKPLSTWQTTSQSAPFLAKGECLRIVLAPPRPCCTNGSNGALALCWQRRALRKSEPCWNRDCHQNFRPCGRLESRKSATYCPERRVMKKPSTGSLLQRGNTQSGRKPGSAIRCPIGNGLIRQLESM